jgi:hypothetical protein
LVLLYIKPIIIAFKEKILCGNFREFLFKKEFTPPPTSYYISVHYKGFGQAVKRAKKPRTVAKTATFYKDF